MTAPSHAVSSGAAAVSLPPPPSPSRGTPHGLPPGLFVTGTDTGVGKTVVSAAITAALRSAGLDVAAAKPVLTGLDEPRAPDEWPPDHEVLAAAAGTRPEVVAPLRFGPPVSPHLAAALAGSAVEPAVLVDAVLTAARGAERVVVEGVGGLLVPLGEGFSVRDLAVRLGLPVVVVARPGLGTINHTLLTVEAARAARLDVRAVVLTPWPAAPTAMERSNRETIERATGIEVAALPYVAAPDPALLAAAGGALPLSRWLTVAA